MTAFVLGVMGVLRLALAVATLGLWGWALAHWLFRDTVDATERTGLAAGLAVGSVGALGYLAWAVGATLDSVVASTLVLGLSGLIVALKYRTRVRWREDTQGAIKWAGFAAVVAALEGIWLSDSADIFYHLAAVRSLLVANRPLVTDLMIANPPPGGLDPTSGIWPTLLAVLARISGLDIVMVVRLVTPVLAAIIAVSFLALVRRTVGRRGRTAALVLMLVVAFLLDFRWAVYPNRIGLAFVAAALLALVVHANSGGTGRFIGVIAIAATVAAVHLASFELLAVITVIFAVVTLAWGARNGGIGAPGKARVAMACAAATVVGGAIAATKIGPAMSSIGFRLGNVDRLVDVRAQIPVVHLGPLAAMAPGPWLAGSWLLLPGALVVAIVLLATRGSERKVAELMAASVALVMPVLAFNLVAVNLIVDRLWYHVARVGAIWPIFLGIPVGALYAHMTEGKRISWWRQLALSALAAGVVVTGARWGAMLSGPADLASLWHSRVYDLGWAWSGHYPVLRDRLGIGDNQVVAAPLGLSYHVSGLLPVRVIAVASAHMPYYAERLQGAVRRHDVFTLFTSSTTKGQTRRILDRYGVEWIMTWTDKQGRLLPVGARHLDVWPDIAVQVYRGGGLAVFRVRRG